METLSGLDTAFLCLDGGSRPMHFGAVLVFDPPRPVHPARIAKLLVGRASTVPQLARSARRTWWPPIGAAWVEDTDFTAENHIHTHRLPRPGTFDQLSPAIAHLMAEPLPAGRPPWQLHVFGGVCGGKFAVLVKLHHALTDGAGVSAVAGALLDELSGPAPHPPAGPATGSDEDGRPTRGGLLGWPSRALRAATALTPGLASGVVERVQQSVRTVGIAAATLVAVRPFAVASPVTSMFGCSARRQWAPARLDAEELHQVRKQLGGTLNDVVLSVVAGGLRRWLCERGDAGTLADGWNLRAFIPVSLRRRRTPGRHGGNHLSGYLCELPLSEPDPIARARTVREAMQRNKAAGPTRGAGAFPLVADALPAAAHWVATPLLGRAAPLLFDAVVTNVPLPDIPLRLDGAELCEIYPIAPLASGHALSVALAVYHGSVHIGLLTDADLLPGVARLATAITSAATTLRHACDCPRIPSFGE